MSISGNSVDQTVKKPWVSSEGVVIPDYAYPLVSFLHSKMEESKDKDYLSKNKVAIPESIYEQVFGLLAERLTFLNNGVPTIKLSVLPEGEYEIFARKGLARLPILSFGNTLWNYERHFGAKKRIVDVLWSEILKAFNIFETADEWVDNYPTSFGKLTHVFTAAILIGLISFITAVAVWALNLFWFLTGSSLVTESGSLQVAITATVITSLCLFIMMVFAIIFFPKESIIKNREKLVISYLIKSTPNLNTAGEIA